MDVLILQIFVSLVLVAGSLVLFGVSARQKDYEHADRLALLPLEADAIAATAKPKSSTHSESIAELGPQERTP